jgi:hypothetical protein
MTGSQAYNYISKGAIMLSDYLTINKRRDHCDLQTKCTYSISRKTGLPFTSEHAMILARKGLCEHLGLTKADVVGMHVCHLCDCDSTHGACSNPKHLYFGTPTENQKDKHYGHYNHPTPDPYCPNCGYQSNSKDARKKIYLVQQHIKNNSCNSKFSKPTRIHPNFQKGDK